MAKQWISVPAANEQDKLITKTDLLEDRSIEAKRDLCHIDRDEQILRTLCKIEMHLADITGLDINEEDL
jgi:hypothetical protein